MHDCKRILDAFVSRPSIHAGAVTAGALRASERVFSHWQPREFRQCVRKQRSLIKAPLFFSQRVERHGYDECCLIERGSLVSLIHQ